MYFLNAIVTDTQITKTLIKIPAVFIAIKVDCTELISYIKYGKFSVTVNGTK